MSAGIDIKAEKNLNLYFQAFYHSSTFSINIHVSRESLGERIENEWMVSFDISQWDLSRDKGEPLPLQITKETRKFNLNLNRFPFRL